ncbi:hypothetical protein [Lichenicoccus sp.]|uniref:hypothetical protein n=1 Tax=Lichenicoccus sp. TaxID=2781899 RepID=UPI003D108C9E
MNQAASGGATRTPGRAPERAVVIHGRDHALFALQAAAPAPRLLLLSAESAACFMGPLWWAALMHSLEGEILAAEASSMLDCGASAGRSMEALRIGLRRLVLAPDCPQFEAVRLRGEALGAELVAERPACLDLGSLDARYDRAGLLRDWLCRSAAPP